MNEATTAPRRIWLCADDYGISAAVDLAIRDLVVRGRLNATSVLVVAPALRRAEAQALATLNRVRPQVAIGLHVALTAPFAPASAGFAPLAGGAFPPLATVLRTALLRRFRHEALVREIEAQMQAFNAAFGRPPDFVDGHQHVQLLPQIAAALIDVVARTAPRAWVRQCRRALPLLARFADRKGLLLDLLSTGFRRRADARGLTTNPAFAGTYTFDAAADFATLFPRFLVGLPEGAVVMCHPGFVDADLARLDPLTTLREKEHAYLASGAFPAALSAHGLALA